MVKETLFEIKKIGKWQRVTAIDAETGIEVTVQVSAKTSRSTALKIASKAMKKRLSQKDESNNDEKAKHDGDIDLLV